jgi:hypothetical protein
MMLKDLAVGDTEVTFRNFPRGTEYKHTKKKLRFGRCLGLILKFRPSHWTILRDSKLKEFRESIKGAQFSRHTRSNVWLRCRLTIHVIFLAEWERCIYMEHRDWRFTGLMQTDRKKISPVPLILQKYSRWIFLGMNENFRNNKCQQVDLVKAIDGRMANIKAGRPLEPYSSE